jgi:hypothetical protein
MPQWVLDIPYDYTWSSTSISAVQQGLTATVSCVETPELDPAVNLNFVPMSPPNTEYKVATLNCVNGTPSKMNQTG